MVKWRRWLGWPRCMTERAQGWSRSPGPIQHVGQLPRISKYGNVEKAQLALLAHTNAPEFRQRGQLVAGTV